MELSGSSTHHQFKVSSEVTLISKAGIESGLGDRLSLAKELHGQLNPDLIQIRMRRKSNRASKRTQKMIRT